jgi:hypothetical protein
LYPLYANTSFVVSASGNYSISADLIRGLELSVFGTPVFPAGLEPFAALPISSSLVPGFSGSRLSTTQNGTAEYFASPSAGTSSSFGTTSQEFSFRGIGSTSGAIDTELYYRDVEAVNATIVRDYERLVGVEAGTYRFPVGVMGSEQRVAGIISPKAALGRGPGAPRQALVQVVPKE